MSQHMEALARANECRNRRVQLGRELAAGETRLSALLRDPELPTWLHGEDVDHLLMRAPGVGPHTMRRVLHRLSIGQKRRMGDLTVRQRRLLSDELAAVERRKETRSAA